MPTIPKVGRQRTGRVAVGGVADPRAARRRGEAEKELIESAVDAITKTAGAFGKFAEADQKSEKAMKRTEWQNEIDRAVILGERQADGEFDSTKGSDASLDRFNSLVDTSTQDFLNNLANEDQREFLAMRDRAKLSRTRGFLSKLDARGIKMRAERFEVSMQKFANSIRLDPKNADLYRARALKAATEQTQSGMIKDEEFPGLLKELNTMMAHAEIQGDLEIARESGTVEARDARYNALEKKVLTKFAKDIPPDEMDKLMDSIRSDEMESMTKSSKKRSLRENQRDDAFRAKFDAKVNQLNDIVENSKNVGAVEDALDTLNKELEDEFGKTQVGSNTLGKELIRDRVEVLDDFFEFSLDSLMETDKITVGQARNRVFKARSNEDISQDMFNKLKNKLDQLSRINKGANKDMYTKFREQVNHILPAPDSSSLEAFEKNEMRKIRAEVLLRGQEMIDSGDAKSVRQLLRSALQGVARPTDAVPIVPGIVGEQKTMESMKQALNHANLQRAAGKMSDKAYQKRVNLIKHKARAIEAENKMKAILDLSPEERKALGGIK